MIENEDSENESVDFDIQLEKDLTEDEIQELKYSQQQSENPDFIPEEDRIPVDDRGIGFLNNKSVEGFVPNRGSVGKLNSEQLEERCELHARRKATGYPTVKEIIANWKMKYGISMHQDSEFQWYMNNQKRVETKLAEMESDGRITHPKTSTHNLSLTLSQAAKENCKAISKANKKIETMFDGMIEQLDPFKSAKTTKDIYMSMTDKDKKEEMRKDLDFFSKLSMRNAENLKAISDVAVSQGKMLHDFLKLAKDLVNIDTNHMPEKRKIESMKQKTKMILTQFQDASKEFDPLDPINDDQRITPEKE